MNYDTSFAKHVGKTDWAGLIGAGQFGASFVGQAIYTQFLYIPVLSELDPEHAAAVSIAAGYASEDMRAHQRLSGPSNRGRGWRSVMRGLSYNCL